ncbi:MAG: hypothetical protein LBH41_01865 [Rickettsiales bacterium]|jgi:hypothetical protein|nr:hypothetical protein [Rickettsiales bacterium]
MKKQTKQQPLPKQLQALILSAMLLSNNNAKAGAEILYTSNTTQEQRNKIEAALDMLANQHPHSAMLQYRLKPSDKNYIGDAVIYTDNTGDPVYSYGTNRIGVSTDISKAQLAEHLNHEGLHMANAISSPELLVLNKALRNGSFYAYLARSMQSEAASWADSTKFLLQSEGRAAFIKERLELSRQHALNPSKGKPDMINYFLPSNYLSALIDHYYGGKLDMPDNQKIWEIGDEIYNNMHKNAFYLNNFMLSGAERGGDVGFMETKYASPDATGALLERYMQLTCPPGVKRSVKGETLMEDIRRVATKSQDVLVDITNGGWPKVRDTIKSNFAEAGRRWNYNSYVEAMQFMFTDKPVVKEANTLFGNIYSFPTQEEYKLLNEILAGSNSSQSPKRPGGILAGGRPAASPSGEISQNDISAGGRPGPDPKRPGEISAGGRPAFGPINFQEQEKIAFINSKRTIIGGR